MRPKSTRPLVPSGAVKFRRSMNEWAGGLISKSMARINFIKTAGSEAQEDKTIEEAAESGCVYYFITTGGSFNKYFVLGVDGFTAKDKWTLGY